MSGEYGKAALIRLFVERDGITYAEAKEKFKELVGEFREVVDSGEDPEDWVMDEVGVDADYIEAFWGYV